MTDEKKEKLEKEATTADSPEEIRSRIEDTRQQMGETIDELQERLSPSNIVEQVKDEVSDQISGAWKSTKETVIDATVNTTGEIMEYVSKGLEEVSDTKIGQTARKNPFAVTLIGAGLGMLLYNAFKGDSSYDNRRGISSRDNRYDRNNRYDRSGRRSLSFGAEDRSTMENAKTKAGQAYDSVSETAGSAYDSAANAAGDAYKSAANAAGDVYDSAGNLVESAYDSAGNLVKTAYDATGNLVSTTYDAAGNVINTGYHKAQKQYDYYIEENPLAIGAVALAVGAAVGLSVPSSNFESNLMGETRDNLVGQATDQVSNFINKAEDIVQEKVEQVKSVANKTVDTAVKEAKNVADKTIETAKNEADKKNLT